MHAKEKIRLQRIRIVHTVYDRLQFAEEIFSFFEKIFTGLLCFSGDSVQIIFADLSVFTEESLCSCAFLNGFYHTVEIIFAELAVLTED